MKAARSLVQASADADLPNDAGETPVTVAPLLRRKKNLPAPLLVIAVYRFKRV